MSVSRISGNVIFSAIGPLPAACPDAVPMGIPPRVLPHTDGFVIASILCPGISIRGAIRTISAVRSLPTISFTFAPSALSGMFLKAPVVPVVTTNDSAFPGKSMSASPFSIRTTASL